MRQMCERPPRFESYMTQRPSGEARIASMTWLPDVIGVAS
jgi:hypothetical protein